MKMPAPLSLDATPRRSAKWYERDDRVVVQRAKPAAPEVVARVREWIRYFLMPGRLRLDETGSRVWRNLDGRTSLSEIIDGLRDERPEDGQDLERRVELFVRALVGQGLVVNEEDSTASKSR
jgi:hypothetical protein